MSNKTIDELKAELAALEGKGKQEADNGIPGENPAYIQDDDPEVQECIRKTTKARASMSDVFAQSSLDILFPIGVADVKAKVASCRKLKRLEATILDESLPKEVRIRAAQEWKEHFGPRSNWNQYPNEELLQRLAPHPHRKRLEELHEFISYRPEPVTDVEEYLKSRRAALAEFRALKNEYPLYDAPYLSFTEPGISYHAQNNGATQKQVRELLGW